MGKGTIIAHLGAGQYTVTLNKERVRIASAISALTIRIAALETRIAGLDDGREKSLVQLQKAALELRKTGLENAPADPAITAWCADLTEDLSGIVGTLEIPGERGTVQVRPGYMGAAIYSGSRDGQLQDAIASTPVGTFYNWAMLPGWQKWMPTIRWGVLSDLDIDAHTCTVTLESAVSSAQGLNINPDNTVLTDVPIEYMSCNAAAFANDDVVLIELEGQSWDSPKVIGFKDNPAPCTTGDFVVIASQVWDAEERKTYRYVTVWNVVGSKVAAISGVTFPCIETDPGFSAWYTNTIDVGEELYTYGYQGQHQDSALLDPCADCDPATGECKTCYSEIGPVEPDPTASTQATKLPFIDPDGNELTNWANCDETQCENAGWIDADYEKNVMLSCYRTIYSGQRLPESLKLDIENDVEGKSAIQISCLQKRVFSGDWLAENTVDTDTYTTYCPLGKMGEVVEREEGMVWAYIPPAEQSQTLVYYGGPVFSALYSTNTLVQIFISTEQTMSRSRDYEGSWGEESWSETTYNLVASCRACDGETTDPRTESRNTAFETAALALYNYAIVQGHGVTAAMAVGIFQYIEP